MPMLELTDQQVVDLVKQLPPQRKRTALLALHERSKRSTAFHDKGTSSCHRLCRYATDASAFSFKPSERATSQTRVRLAEA